MILAQIVDVHRLKTTCKYYHTPAALEELLDVPSVVTWNIAQYHTSFRWYATLLGTMTELPEIDVERGSAFCADIFTLIKLCDQITERMPDRAQQEELLSYARDAVFTDGPSPGSISPEEAAGIQALAKRASSHAHEPTFRNHWDALASAWKHERFARDIADYIRLRGDIGAASGMLVAHCLERDASQPRSQAISAQIGKLGNLIDGYLDWPEDVAEGIVSFPTSPYDRQRFVPQIARESRSLLQIWPKGHIGTLIGISSVYVTHELKNALRTYGLQIPRFDPKRMPDALQPYFSEHAS